MRFVYITNIIFLYYKQNAMESEDLRLTAKSFCCTPDEWHDVSLMNKSKLQKYISHKQFESQQNLKNTFFIGFHRLIAYAADTVTRANGHVQQQMMVDLPLQEAIELEALPLLAFLSNRSKIAMLFFHDVIQGKMTQRSLEPEAKIVLEENGHCQEISSELVDSNEDCRDGSTEKENNEAETDQVSGFD
jgi:hypothetical protein